MTIRNFTVGASTMRVEDNVAAHMARLAKAAAISGTKGAERTKAEILKVFRTRGGGTWPANAPSTIARKGSNKPLFDTGILVTSLEIRPKSIGAAEYSAKIGWFDEPHPGTGGRLSVAELAAVHDGLTGAVGGFHETSAAIIPVRPHISMVAYDDKKVQEILTDMDLSFRRSYLGGKVFGPQAAPRASEPEVDMSSFGEGF